jgi:DNA-binding transcriptional LysR family regulator
MIDRALGDRMGDADAPGRGHVLRHLDLPRSPPLIAASDLIITLPERVARIVCASHPLRSVPLPIKVPAFDVVLAWHERVHRDPANAWLRDQVLQAMRG